MPLSLNVSHWQPCRSHRGVVSAGTVTGNQQMITTHRRRDGA